MRVISITFLTILSVFGLSCSSVFEDSREEVTQVFEFEPVGYATRSSVNLIDRDRLILGASISWDGTVVEDASKQSVVTSLIPVYIGNQWYQKVLFLQVCCLRNDTYGFCADTVVFYDKDKNFLRVEKGNDSPILIPDNAFFARIQFRQTDQLLFASVTNRTVINPYSEYDKNNLVADPVKNYQTVDNSASSISHFLRTGSDYFDRGFGYGSLHTAFNSDCRKAESYDDHYEGLKWQIDCSSYVELALTGVHFYNSRYNRGSEADNIADANSFVFDQFTEYNYNMIRFPEECGADNGRLYANKIAKYFYDRGLLYEVEENFANVNTGDLLFWGNGSSNNRFFLGIGHVAICSDSWLKKRGGKGIRVMENAYESVKEYSQEIRYGARPILPAVENVEESAELVDRVSLLSGSCNLNAGETTLVSNLYLKEDLQLRELYTLFIKCDVPDGIAIICKNRIDRLSLGSEDVEELYPSDGLITKHFGIRERMLGGKKNVIGVYLYSPTDLKCEFKIDTVSMKRGYRIEQFI